MDQQELVTEILEEFFPDECDITGPANVRRLAAGTRDSIRVHGGSNLDMTQVLSELQSVVVILYGSIAILQSLKRSSPGSEDSPPTRESALRSLPDLARIDPAKREAIVDRIVGWLKDNPDAGAPWNPEYDRRPYGPR